MHLRHIALRTGTVDLEVWAQSIQKTIWLSPSQRACAQSFSIAIIFVIRRVATEWACIV